jgi:hypothetical protein
MLERITVNAKLKAASDQRLVGPLRSRTYNQFGTEPMRAPIHTRAEVKAEVLEPKSFAQEASVVLVSFWSATVHHPSTRLFRRVAPVREFRWIAEESSERFRSSSLEKVSTASAWSAGWPLRV